ncbi:MAG: hypothetical protein IJ007_07420, partial [Oscillospiraceae bacterium]|nr:hypothetical protein [Oscillospiraceae bacterium]
MTANLKKIITAGVIIISTAIFALALDKLLFPEDAFSTRTLITLDTQNGMTVRQRVKDFDDMCSVLENNAPYIYGFEQLYGISFKETADFYRSLVEQTESDFEYLAVNAAFLNNIPSFHMTLRIPDPDPGRFVYTANEYSGYEEALSYWKNIVLDSKNKYGGAEFYKFTYIGGSYFLEQDGTYTDAELISVNGVPISEFILLFPCLNKLAYDHQNSVPFREFIYFNNSVGEEYTVELKNADGTVSAKTLFYSVPAQIAAKSDDYYAEKTDQTVILTAEQLAETEITADGFYAFRNEELAYIYFNDFSRNAANAVEYIKTNDLPEKIILDLRDNTGGLSYHALLLAEMFSQNDIALNDFIYTSSPEFAFSEAQRIKKKELPFETSFRELYRLPADFQEIKGCAEKQYDLTLLVSYKTGSAADNFSVHVKNNGLGKIVGAFSTGGEAHGSPHMGVLEKSGLTFTY